MADQQRQRTILDVTQDQAGSRLDQFAADKLGMTRSQVQKLIKEGVISLAGAKSRPKDLVSPSVQVWYEIDQSSVLKFSPKPMDLDIVYEDKDILVLNKPPGLVVHPGAGTQGAATLIEGVAHYLKTQGESLPGEQLRPGIVHRLDKDTSGLLVVAKNTQALDSLAQQFRAKSNLREYVALVDGVFDRESQTIETYLLRDPRHRTRFTSISEAEYRSFEDDQRRSCRYAKSTFLRGRVYNNRVSLVLVRLSTGRTHQIRIHCRELKLPIIGDRTYGKKMQVPGDFPQEGRRAIEAVSRQMLHAKKLGFVHPRTGEHLGFEVPLHKDMMALVSVLEGQVSN